MRLHTQVDISNPIAGFCADSAIHKMTESKFDVIVKMHNYTPYRMIQALSRH